MDHRPAAIYFVRGLTPFIFNRIVHNIDYIVHNQKLQGAPSLLRRRHVNLGAAQFAHVQTEI
jgi:hypothetical protein